MTLAEHAPAARKATALIAVLKRAAQRGRNGARARADLGDLAIGVVAHHHAGRIARQALRRSRGNVRATLEDRLATRIGVRQHRGIDVDHDLITLPPKYPARFPGAGPSRRRARARPPPAARWWALPENRPRTPVPRDRP